MPDPATIDLELDIMGMLCPLPLVVLSREIAKVPMGGIIRAVSDDPACPAEVTVWSAATGHELVSSTHEGDEYVFLIRRRK